MPPMMGNMERFVWRCAFPVASGVVNSTTCGIGSRAFYDASVRVLLRCILRPTTREQALVDTLLSWRGSNTLEPATKRALMASGVRKIVLAVTLA